MLSEHGLMSSKMHSMVSNQVKNCPLIGDTQTWAAVLELEIPLPTHLYCSFPGPLGPEPFAEFVRAEEGSCCLSLPPFSTNFINPNDDWILSFGSLHQLINNKQFGVGISSWYRRIELKSKTPAAFYFQPCPRISSILTEQAVGTDNLLQWGPSNLSPFRHSIWSQISFFWFRFPATEPSPLLPRNCLQVPSSTIYGSQWKSSCTSRLKRIVSKVQFSVQQIDVLGWFWDKSRLWSATLYNVFL